MKYTNKQIVEKIQQGNKNDALEYIYKHYFPKVYSALRKRNTPMEDIKDIFQDTVLILIKRILENRYQGEMNVCGFLISVALKIWIDKIRKDHRLTFSDEELDYRQTKITSSFLENTDKKKLVKEIFDSIGDRCSKLMKLIYYQKFNMKEVSEFMGFSGEDSAKAQHYRCKQKLIEKYKNKPYLKEVLIGV